MTGLRVVESVASFSTPLTPLSGLEAQLFAELTALGSRIQRSLYENVQPCWS
ncbi:MAG: hypothetical protein WD825_08230 [Gemmatimonadaceae bacterium]